MELNFLKLKKNIKKDFSNYKKIKIAILGDSATQFLSQALKGYGYEVELDYEIYESDYNQIHSEILNQDSNLYKFNPEFIIIFNSIQKIQNKFYKEDNNGKNYFSVNYIEQIESYIEVLNSNLKCKIINFNFPNINDSIFGNYSTKVKFSSAYQINKINLLLMELSQVKNNFFICDISSLVSRFGEEFSFDNKFYINGDMAFSVNFFSYIAKNISDIILSTIGKIKKCLVLDLDNTLWGGIIGDDGIEKIQIGFLGIGKAFSEFQLWIKQLKERGVILTVCSKNNENIAKEPFLNHPEMILKESDFSLFVANWDAKPKNIQFIADTLNIGLDSMVFIDDNPFERNYVREVLPEVCTPEIPEDPADYLSFIKSLNLFETASYSFEDSQRTEMYQEQAKRNILKKSFLKEDDYLISLEMKSKSDLFNSFNVSRISQLTQRSNQFNLRTKRYSDDDIKFFLNSKKHIKLACSLEDKFGDYSLISIIIGEEKNDSLFIDTWIMSCRVLNRGMENFLMNLLVNEVRKKGLSKITGEYLPTPKNVIVKNFLNDMGFFQSENLYELEVKDYKNKECFIDLI